MESAATILNTNDTEYVNCPENGCPWSSQKCLLNTHLMTCFYANQRKRMDYFEIQIENLLKQNLMLTEKVNKQENLLSKFAKYITIDGDNDLITIQGANLQILNDREEYLTSSTTEANGKGNLIIGFNKSYHKKENAIEGSHNLLIGDGNQVNGCCSIIVGNKNKVYGDCSVVAGNKNESRGNYCVCFSATSNRLEGWCSCVIGGSYNNLLADQAVVINSCHQSPTKKCSVTQSKPCNSKLCCFT